MSIFGSVICWAITILLILIFVRTVLSWVPFHYDSMGKVVAGYIFRITDPIFRPIQRVLPAVRMGNVALDFSPMLVVILLFILRGIIC